MKLPIAAIILTYNEEKNIEACLESIRHWAGEIFVVDSYSTDRTLELASRYTDRIVQHPFEDYGKQRNWAQEHLPLTSEWAFHLDADERVTPELAQEIKAIFETGTMGIDGFLIKRRIVFLGRWLKHGGTYPVYHLRLFRKEMGKCEDRRYDQHFLCRGTLARLRHDIENRNDVTLTDWIDRHNRWSSTEAEELLMGFLQSDRVKERILGNPIERKRWLKNRLFKNAPLFFRSFVYFFYRYFFQLGFLDGKEGLIFHCLQGFWFRFLVDAKIYEQKKALTSGEILKR